MPSTVNSPFSKGWKTGAQNFRTLENISLLFPNLGKTGAVGRLFRIRVSRVWKESGAGVLAGLGSIGYAVSLAFSGRCQAFKATSFAFLSIKSPCESMILSKSHSRILINDLRAAFLSLHPN